MTKTIRTVTLVTLLSLMLVCLSGCFLFLSEDDVVGTWTGTYVYNGNDFAVAFALSPDGTYEYISLKNGEFNKMENGDWEVKGNKVILYDDSSVTYHGMSSTFTFKRGALVNNDHYFYKAS